MVAASTDKAGVPQRVGEDAIEVLRGAGRECVRIRDFLAITHEGHGAGRFRVADSREQRCAVARSVEPGHDDLPDGLAACDALIVPSVDDPFPQVPLEAMARGRPVVATGRGGSAEYLRDEHNCLLFPADDAESVLAFLDASGQLSEIQVFYRGKTADHYPGPDDLALLWEEQLGTTSPSDDLPGLRRRTYLNGLQTCEVNVSGRSSVVGVAWIT